MVYGFAVQSTNRCFGLQEANTASPTYSSDGEVHSSELEGTITFICRVLSELRDLTSRCVPSRMFDVLWIHTVKATCIKDLRDILVIFDRYSIWGAPDSSGPLTVSRLPAVCIHSFVQDLEFLYLLKSTAGIPVDSLVVGEVTKSATHPESASLGRNEATPKAANPTAVPNSASEFGRAPLQHYHHRNMPK
eukprot:Selendium_serpulae@DN3649_c0_g1_i3.p1